MMVSLALVNASIFASLALLCVAVLAGLRRESALAWLAAALLSGATEVLVLALGGGSPAELALVAVLVPVAYLCAGQCVRVVTGGTRPNWKVAGTVIVLTGISVLLLLFETPFIYQTLPFQLACAIAVLESAFRLHRTRSMLNTCLMLIMLGIASVFLIRIPLFPLLFDAATPYVAIKTSPLETTLLTISGLLVPPGVFILLAKVVGNVIAGYRARSERDGMTGLLNRQAFDEAAEALDGTGGAVVFCDIDRFKQVNDRYGHQTGDGVIRAFAALLAGTGHRAGRMGGEEFALLVPGRTAAEAAAEAEAIRRRFNEIAHDGLPAGRRLSASFGVADYRAGELPANAFARADMALYRAKKDGRNRVVTLDGDKGAEAGMNQPKARQDSYAA